MCQICADSVSCQGTLPHHRRANPPSICFLPPISFPSSGVNLGRYRFLCAAFVGVDPSHCTWLASRDPHPTKHLAALRPLKYSPASDSERTRPSFCNCQSRPCHPHRYIYYCVPESSMMSGVVFGSSWCNGSKSKYSKPSLEASCS